MAERPGGPPTGARAALALPASPAGIVIGAVGFGASLVPGLYPRHSLIQGALSGLAIALGYGLGSMGARTAQRFASRRQPGRSSASGRLVAVVVASAIGIVALWWHAQWQTEVRALMRLERGVSYPIAMVVIAVVTAYLLVLLGRFLRAVRRQYVRLLSRAVPSGWLPTVRRLVAGALVVFVLSGLPTGWATAGLNAALASNDAYIDPEVAPPSTPYRSGGPGSLVTWATLGFGGRRFVGQGPSTADLQAFSGRPAVPPIRVYVGVGAAPTDSERAQLAVAELERTGAFARSVLVVVVPTGSGTINPYAIDPLEYMYGGDTAAVAMQYGYLPSWVTMAGNQERAQQGARALFAAVSERLAEEPPESRPRLLVYGESLGSFGSESIFTRLEDARRRTDGVLWVGPTRGNRLWRELTAGRDRGSPAWEPVIGGGALVRFGTDGASLREPVGDWPFPRIAYLQHATDPITWHSPALIFKRPEWLEHPRGPDIPDTLPHIPVLTAVQLMVDMALAETAPLGHGHMYGPEQAEAWAQIAPPPGWSPDATGRLVAELTARS